MKVIFLDFDGVLLPLPTDGHYEPDLKPGTEAMNNLNLLIQLTRAEVVVTSAWRVSRTVKELEELLKSWGYKWSVLDKTKNGDGDEDRGYDIQYWLANSREVIDAFVVIDDDRTDLELFADKMVSPKPDKGLQFHDVSEAVRILEKSV